MGSLDAYFAMGGYAVFVWSAYALTALVMVGLTVVTWRSLKARESELKMLQEMMPTRRGRKHDARD